jgi:hypothetical protein
MLARSSASTLHRDGSGSDWLLESFAESDAENNRKHSGKLRETFLTFLFDGSTLFHRLGT